MTGVRRAGCALVIGLAWQAGAIAATLCETGRRQSPIDIVAPQAAAGPALQFQYRPAPLRVVNDGHTVRVRIANGSRLLIGGQPHTLQQVHFHMPGGDRVAGEEFPMALHLPHKSAAGGLVALVVLFRAGKENAALAALLPDLPARGLPERTLAGRSVDPAALLPADKAYYAYDGSLTGPPCTEGVRWIVLKTPQQASSAQLAQLAQLFAPNARAVQPLNGRRVTANP